MNNYSKILILDYGSQYTQLIARRIRELNVYSEVIPHNSSLSKIKQKSFDGLILSGGPMSVYGKSSYKLNKNIFDFNIPILGICYGMQLLIQNFGGKVEPSKIREFGHMNIRILNSDLLFDGVKDETAVWMSHGDKIISFDKEWSPIAYSDNNVLAAIKHKRNEYYGVQFHPEVIHTVEGDKILSNFLFKIANCKPSWTPQNFIKDALNNIKNKVGDKNVICGISGGVDSSVMGALINKAVKGQAKFVFVNHGLLRKNEEVEVMSSLKDGLGMDIECIDASKIFLDSLKGVEDPEQKRKIIGKLFVDTFDEVSKNIEGIEFLAQGTLYPDVIESGGSDNSVTIKSHHNVGGLPDKLNFELIEPLRDLFKDEVREVGKELAIPDFLIDRHPFPGPGLAVRIIGEITQTRIDMLKEADDIFIKTLVDKGEYNNIWQAFAVLIPIKTVGVMGDGRTYENLIALRAVTSKDGMTADWYRMPESVLQMVSNKIINEVKGVNRVVYDITSKPPGTIEWE
ncbi:MAG: glutamine-hydrolyzing GMP synthase [Candidatus Marinimicrobia bacterium]|nr:glutamine-hydrolyzing GMP synthase [Candidatus Neomarinimicrobiota bacterium]|tara:strand:+ start:7020 stop:8558 length:1539 start_codon:yes stop_codon:yes gene_type:complete